MTFFHHVIKNNLSISMGRSWQAGSRFSCSWVAGMEYSTEQGVYISWLPKETYWNRSCWSKLSLF